MLQCIYLLIAWDHLAVNFWTMTVKTLPECWDATVMFRLEVQGVSFLFFHFSTKSTQKEEKGIDFESIGTKWFGIFNWRLSACRHKEMNKITQTTRKMFVSAKEWLDFNLEWVVIVSGYCDRYNGTLTNRSTWIMIHFFFWIS